MSYSAPMLSAVAFLAVGAPLLVAVVTLLIGWRPSTGRASVLSALIILGCGIYVGTSVGSQRALTAGHLLGADALSSVMLIVIGSVGTLATWANIGYLGRNLSEGKTTARAARRYGILVAAFMSAMALAVQAESLGVVWAAVEATTVITAFLVGHRGTRDALEATWKYVVICSFGIGLAFLGTVVLYFASIKAGATPSSALDIHTLIAYAPKMNPAVARLAIGLLLIGFGTKVGLVPFHTWLADAHGQAPAPVSALMSGVLLSVALSVLLRLEPIAASAVGPTYMRVGLAAMGLATILVAVSLLVGQKDLKRLLGYSSLEQMGFMAVAASAGSRTATAGVLLMVLAHGLVKAVLFVAAGDIQHAHGSTEIASIRGLLGRSTLVGPVFAAGLFGLLGFPPFALFSAEIAMSRGLAQAHEEVVLVVALALLIVGFVSIAKHSATMLLGYEVSQEHPTATANIVEVHAGVKGPLVVGIIALVAVGVTAGPLAHLITSAATVVGSSR